MIDILLATYNSATYLPEQIDSIIDQTYKDWRLIIRDDGSKDDSIKIINEYIKNHPDKIRLLSDRNNLGVKGNFNKLLSSSGADYIMFSDHDDIWLKDKITDSYELMKEYEKKYGKNTPLLIFTDKSVTDSNMNMVYPSHSRSEKFDTKRLVLNRILVQNVASGCTMMINKALKEIIGDIPPEAIMHDYWLMIAAAAFGHIAYLDKPTMLYRQHGANECGAVAYNFSYIFDKIKKGRKNARARFDKNIVQGVKFLDYYKDTLSVDKKAILEEFAKLAGADAIKFRLILIKNGFLKSGIIRKIGMLAPF